MPNYNPATVYGARPIPLIRRCIYRSRGSSLPIVLLKVLVIVWARFTTYALFSSIDYDDDHHHHDNDDHHDDDYHHGGNGYQHNGDNININVNTFNRYPQNLPQTMGSAA
ncbi:hypothetical protein KCP70_16680 [Salmonella enterica subsp. enterica]|nr:hypothetical protein KCP70_16680 [Salmonella enterica subsp. enterica]